MNKYFYGSLDEFVEKLKECNLNVSVQGNIVKIDNGYIECSEKKLPIRSFSVPRFPSDGVLLNCVNVDESLIEKICLRYNKEELASIERDMPIISFYANNHKDTLKEVAIIWRDHFLEENIGLLSGFVKMGVKPENILAIDKGDSTQHRFEITETFRTMGFNVDVLDNTDLENAEILKRGRKIIFDFIEARENLKIVVLDDGAIITQILDKKYFDNLVGVVELTEMGLRRIKAMDNYPTYPVLNIAKTKLKRNITYTEISNTIFTRIVELLHAEKLVGRSVILCGYGDLGEILADRLRMYGVRVGIVDTDILRLIVAAERGFNTYKNCLDAVRKQKPFMIIGASGYRSISKDVLELLPQYGYVTAGATADLHAFREYEQDGIGHMKIDKYGTQYFISNKYIDVLGNGRSVNLFDSEAIPNKSNDIFKASQLVAVYNMTHVKKLEDRIELNVVDDWIEKSGILEKYYELYME